MLKMCNDCLHFDHCINIPNYPVTDNTIGCGDWVGKDKYVPVVRCRDCKHRKYLRGATSDAYTCSLGWGLSGIVAENDFCSYGERKDGEG